MSDTPSIIEHGFSTFMQAAFRVRVTERDRELLRCAFFAGALWHSGVLRTLIDGAGENMDREKALIQAMGTEMAAFFADMISKRTA